jgi:putative oxidoreductase
MFQLILRSTTRLLRIADALEWLPPLLVRLFVGYMFLELGWAKLHNLAGFTQRFIGWGIPYPAFNAALSAYTECIGGALILFGLLTRLASVPMMINMAVAIVTVKMKAVASVSDFVELDEPLYLLSFFWLMISGPGVASLDHLLKRFFASRFEIEPPDAASGAQASQGLQNRNAAPAR